MVEPTSFQFELNPVAHSIKDPSSRAWDFSASFDCMLE